MGTSRYSTRKKHACLYRISRPKSWYMYSTLTIQYLLIVCIEIYTCVNTYNRLQYTFHWINSVNCCSDPNRLALSETQTLKPMLYCIGFNWVSTGVQNMPAQKCHFCVCRRWWMYWCNTAQGQGWCLSYWNIIVVHLLSIFFPLFGFYPQHFHDLRAGGRLCYFKNTSNFIFTPVLYLNHICWLFAPWMFIQCQKLNRYYQFCIPPTTELWQEKKTKKNKAL